MTPKKDVDYAGKFLEFNSTEDVSLLNSEESDRYKYLAYKTFAFMLKNGLNRVKLERVNLLETVKQQKIATLKIKTQLHVVNSLYRIESRLHEKACREIGNLKKVVNEKEKAITAVQLRTKDDEISAKKEMEQQLIKLNLIEYRLTLKDEEIERLKGENLFLIEQRQQMEDDFNEKLKLQFEVISRLQAMLMEESQEIDRLQLVVDSLEM